jgi:hypothetical protein
MAAVGLVYAPLAPLVALAAAVVFWMSMLVYKYQIMFVFVSKVESGGVWLPRISGNPMLTRFFLASMERRNQSLARVLGIDAIAYDPDHWSFAWLGIILLDLLSSTSTLRPCLQDMVDKNLHEAV